MFGKKILKFVVVSFIFLISGCSNKMINNDINNITLSQVENISYKNIDINDYFNNSTELLPPNNYEFIPHKLVEDKFIVGEATASYHPYPKYLGIYDIATQKLKIINPIKEKSSLSIEFQKILSSNSKYIIYEEYSNETSKYYIYNVEKEETNLILEKNKVPELHDSQASINSDYFALSILDDENKYYNLKLYKISDLSNEEISNVNSGFPVFYNDNLYYIEIDNEKFITKLIKYSYKDNLKKDVYSIENKDSYIAFLNVSNEQLLIGIRNNENTSIYTLNNNEDVAKFNYESSWMESVDFNGQLVTYLGDNNIENRNRMKYYLINIKDKINIENNNGPIYLSNKGILWIEYKFEDKDIPKGQIFNRTYTKMMFKKFN